MATRRQLTLFVPPDRAAAIEKVRRIVDPIQATLIAAHVTLCREDEIAPLDDDELARRLGAPELAPLTLTFGPPEPFASHGLLLPCIGGEPTFRTLREEVLGHLGLRHQPPHITLAHPRNPRAPGNSRANAAALRDLAPIAFQEVALIEQTGVEPWRPLATFALGRARKP